MASKCEELWIEILKQLVIAEIYEWNIWHSQDAKSRLWRINKKYFKYLVNRGLMDFAFSFLQFF